MLKIKSNRKTAFTLAETLITVVILGIVAAILVPSLIKNQVENANRTKVKKAMASYEKAINYMIIENDIRETESLRELGQDNCQYTREYFKTVKDGSNNCIFKTADRVWWDITDITNPILILKDSQLEKSETELKTLAKNVNDNTVFALVGRFDDLGTLRVNDNAYEQGLENNFTNQKYVGKLWYFITQSTSVLTGLQKCQAEGATTCKVGNVTYKQAIFTGQTVTKTGIDNVGSKICIYDRMSVPPASICDGSFKLTTNNGNIVYYLDMGTVTAKDAKDYTNSICYSSGCATYGDYYEAVKRKCTDGTHIATLAELKDLKNIGKISSGTFWSSAETRNDAYYFSADNGNVGDFSKAHAYNVICVGD